MKNEPKESPAYLRTSLAAAMTLGLKPGLFYRNARLHCLNLLLTYEGGCKARCAYCGLSGKRPGQYSEKSFIRVTWPTCHLEEIITRTAARTDRIKRTCISMVTHPRAVAHTLEICARLRSSIDIPISVLLAPTVIQGHDLYDLKAAGADKVGVAIDLATPELFAKYRGNGVRGPHQWEVYWRCLEDAARIFGGGNAGPHFMVGMGETEKEMCAVIQTARDMGCRTHLFSFFPEAESPMADHPQPPMDQYRRIQLARYLIDEQVVTGDRLCYDPAGKITGFGLPQATIDRVVDGGEAFRTSGCSGRDGEVACNRPFGNSRPGPAMRNYPFPPDPEDIRLIRSQMVARK